MKKESIVKLTNRLSIIAVILLLYWVFIFTVSSVFGFKVFKENITQTFFLAILGILALLAASVIVNIMYNLTIISDALAPKEATPADGNRQRRHFWVWAFIISFPLIGLLLYLGDIRTSQVKERQLLKSAQYMIENHREAIDRIAVYSFASQYIDDTTNALKLMSREDKNFPSVSVILQDLIDNKPVFLQFSAQDHWNKYEEKIDYIYPCSFEERQYLTRVFTGNIQKPHYTASDGFYALYYPVKTKNRIIILFFTDRQRYGKLGS